MSDVGKSRGDEGEKVCDIPAYGNCRGPRLAENIADHDHVHHDVYDLQEVGQKQRQSEGDKLPGDVSLSKIFDLTVRTIHLYAFFDV